MSDDLSITHLVICAAHGDEQAWDVLVERYAPLVWSICRRYRLSDADTRDGRSGPGGRGRGACGLSPGVTGNLTCPKPSTPRLKSSVFAICSTLNAACASPRSTLASRSRAALAMALVLPQPPETVIPLPRL